MNRASSVTFAVALVLKAALFASMVLASEASGAAALRLACSGVGQELRLCRDAAQDWARAHGHEVRIVTVPTDASERLALYRQLLSEAADAVDVQQIDVIWTGLLGRHLLDLKPYSNGAKEGA